MKNETIIPIALKALTPSPFNPRTVSGLAAHELKDLATSILAQGIQQPIVVREVKPGRYEIIFGHRRCAAAEIAKLKTVPCLVRVMDDAQVREVQLIENLQREGISEIEEAGGYADLLALGDPLTRPAGTLSPSDGERAGERGAPIPTVESIAAKIGKSPAYIYARLKLLKLPELALLAAQAKVLPASTALLIARIPDPKLALKATAEILGLNAKDEAGLVKELKEKISKPDDYHWWSPMSFRKAKHHVAASYTKRLKGCGFDPEDALLVVAAGACSACPFRSGNLKDLKPADLGGTDVCTNPACYRAKVDATQRAQDAALKARTGAAKIVTASAAGLTTDYVKGHATTVQRPGEYLALHAKPDGKNKSFEELLDVDDVEKFVSRDPNDARKHHVLVRVADVAPQLKELKLPVPQPEAKAGPRDHAAEQKEREQRQAEAQVFLDTLRPRVTKALLKVKPEKLLLYHILEHCRPNAKETALLKKMKLDQLVRVLVPWHGKVLYGDEIARGDVAVAKLAGIDLVAEVKGYRKEQAKAAAAKVK